MTYFAEGVGDYVVFAAVVIALCAYLVYHERRSSQRFEAYFASLQAELPCTKSSQTKENRSTDYRFV